MTSRTRIHRLLDVGTQRKAIWDSRANVDSTYKSSAFEYVPERIRLNQTKIDNPVHRDVWVREDPYLKRLVVDRSSMMFEGGISILTRESREEDQAEPHPAQDEVLERLEILRYRDVLSMASQFEMTHGFCPILIMERDDTWEGGLETGVPGWSYDHPEEAKFDADAIDRLVPIDCLDVETVELDRVGDPDILVYKYQLQGMRKPLELSIHASRCVWTNTRPVDRSYSGLEVPRPIWDSLIWLAWTSDSMGWHDSKHGPGIFFVKPGTTLTGDMEDDMGSNLRNVSKRQGLLMPPGQSEVGWAGPTSTPDYSAHLEWHINGISAATGAPKNWLRGDQQGSVTGSETDLKELFSHLRIMQDRWRRYIRLIIDLLFPDLGDYRVKYNLRFVMDEVVAAQVALQKAQAASIMQQFAELEEVRDFYGLDGDIDPEKVAAAQTIQLQIEQREEAGAQGEGEAGKAKSGDGPREQLRDTAPRLYQLCTDNGVDGWPQLRAVLLDRHGSMTKTCQPTDKGGAGISRRTWHCWESRYNDRILV